VAFFSPSGKAIAAAGRPTTLGKDPVADLIRDNRRRGIHPEWDTGMPRYHHSAPIPWEIEADAWVAMDRAAEPAPATSTLEECLHEVRGRSGG